MYNCYCKNCNNLIGKWYDEYKYYDILDYCNYLESKNNKSIYFLDCINCDKFVGISGWYVCENCFGKNQIFGEKNLFNWFQKYKKITHYNYKLSYSCKNCNNKKKFRLQHWFFKELTFYK